MDPQGFAVARKQSWYPRWKMSSSFIVSNDDGFYILSVESKLWKKLDCANLCTCVCIYCNHWSDQESNEEPQTSLIVSPTHPRTSFLSVVFFPLLITVMLLPKSAAESTAHRKPFQDQVWWQWDKCHWDLARRCPRQEEKTHGIWGVPSVPCSYSIPQIGDSLFI